MKIAIPTAHGMLCPHFGHCETFTIIDIAPNGEISAQHDETPPPHEPGVLPEWLRSLGVDQVIAGGMGGRAQGLFNQYGISVTVGVQSETPEEIAQAFATGTLVSGNNICDH